MIELLVVVLIIAILSAVALPMYTKSVRKTKFTNTAARISELAKAIDFWCLQNGTDCVNNGNYSNPFNLINNIGDLHITIPAEWKINVLRQAIILPGGDYMRGNITQVTDSGRSYLQYSLPKSLLGHAKLFTPIYSSVSGIGTKYRGRVYCLETAADNNNCGKMLGLNVGNCATKVRLFGAGYGCSYDDWIL